MDEKNYYQDLESLGVSKLHNDEEYILEMMSQEMRGILQKMMEQDEISLSNLARKLNTSKQYLFAVLKGKRKLSLKFIIKMAVALNCKLEIKIEHL